MLITRSTLDDIAIDCFFFRQTIAWFLIGCLHMNGRLVLYPTSYLIGAITMYIIVFALVCDYLRHYRFGTVVAAIEGIAYGFAWQAIMWLVLVACGIFSVWLLIHYALSGPEGRKHHRSFLREMWGINASV